MNGRFSPHTGKIILFQMKDRIFPAPDTVHSTAEMSWKNRRPRSAAHAHVERQDKNKIQHNIQKRGEHQKIQGRPAVSQRAENIGYHIIKYRRAGSGKNGKHIIISHPVISSGVCIQCRIGWARPQQTPVRTTVNTTPHTSEAAILLRMPASSPAPHLCPRQIPESSVIPWIKQSTR